ncbi:hypothetical protein M2282_003059 [Variovorax boronicumulans]|uniref:pilus assembly protein TadG-related protein n=1 Tax=Variovorax boronicumulans TaxID=436515 RepID=UPI0024744C74|nr:pilus assembly protein TadG-related protein [Variovorax boronicumulans]MDH6167908.1 hypothetical protein [Variovorax boronicumulans]
MVVAPRSNTNAARQSGQAIVYLVAMLPVIFLSVLVVYNTAQSTREKIRLQNTADATTYSAGVLTARTLNYLSYTNRAMAGNEAGIATLASVQTSIGAFVTSAANIQEGLVVAKGLQGANNLARSARPIVGIVYYARWLGNVGQAFRLQRKADRIADLVEPLAKPTQFAVDALRVLNEGISLSQTAMLASSVAQMPQLIAEVLKSNDPEASLPASETEIFAIKFVADLGTYLDSYHQSGNGPFNEDEYNEVMRFAHSAQALRDDWTKKRRFLPDWASWIGASLAGPLQGITKEMQNVPPGFSSITGLILNDLVEWKGGTELVATDGPAGGEMGRIRWQSADSIEIKLPLGVLYTDIIGGLGDIARGRFGLGAGAAAAGGPHYMSSWEGQRLTLRSYFREARDYGGLNSKTNDIARIERGSFRYAADDSNGGLLPATWPVLVFNAKMHYGPRTAIGSKLTQDWTLPRYVDVKEHPPMVAHEADNWLAQNGFKGSNPLKWGKNTDKGPALTLVVQKGGDKVRTGEVAGFGNPNADGRVGLRDNFAGRQIKAVSTAQVYFRRPQDRWARRDFSTDDPPTIGKYNVGFAGGYIEHRSLFSPYWHVHNVEPSLWARAVAVGGAVFGASADEDGAN